MRKAPSLPLERTAITGPRSLRDPRSREYAIQTIRSLKRYLESKSIDAKGVARELDEIRRHKHWQVLGFKSLDAYLLAEIGMPLKQLKSRLVQDLAHVGELERMQHAHEVDAQDQVNQRPVGRPKQIGIFDKKKDDVKDLAPTGNSETYALRRLRKNRPDIHQRVLSGELTPHAGMIEAGFRKKRASKKLTPLDHLNKWWDRATPEQRAQFWAEKAERPQRGAA